MYCLNETTQKVLEYALLWCGSDDDIQFGDENLQHILISIHYHDTITWNTRIGTFMTTAVTHMNFVSLEFNCHTGETVYPYVHQVYTRIKTLYNLVIGTQIMPRTKCLSSFALITSIMINMTM